MSFAASIQKQVLSIVSTPGVIRIVGNQNQPVSGPDHGIEIIQAVFTV